MIVVVLGFLRVFAVKWVLFEIQNKVSNPQTPESVILMNLTGYSLEGSIDFPFKPLFP
jgi:hypothetical protein